ncbi:lipopolysaccharide biosynthesis protein [Klebsiella michiganensis]|uniref:lipopolysaccharide biosynthesis protein n=1 Tax=Klebsiella michiganensis TaxID=1134687 RepID=UPI0012B70301|nr:lipopolysaccharide biosynthesis protein [Klebsiella michiganensis]EKV4190121.1 lipopolysaccharide biosynthesis protein [Klebsiella michiganensis]MBE0115627.1 lipopolysaccharide biosynthesis protein [Klebsiella michiganensis]HDF2352953.1 lipopolysaccharide biosynthesis protein [Klebsiella michiganensis]HED3412333.1 lipopolysaccharide biosynthesis protein [Klebsiella michiganensis]
MNLLSNVKWNTISQIFKILIQSINLIYLAKLIPPTEYGLLAIAVVFVNFANLLRDLGTSASLVQSKILTEGLINTVFWFNLLMGIAICILLCLVSPIISNFYEHNELKYILMLLSITFPLSSVATAHLALLERDSKFKKTSVIEVISSSFSVIVAIVLAKIGYGVYSLVIQSIVLNLLSAIMFWIASGWNPSIRLFIQPNELKRIFGFSANLTGFNFINYFSRNLDSFLIGKFMSTSILGNYNLAYRIMLFPLQSLTFIMARSLYPILSHYQDDEVRVRDNYLKCVFVVLAISAPLMSGIALFSQDIVNVFFGDKWVLTGIILQWLAPTAIIQSVLSTTGAVFTAKGRTDILFRLGGIGAILQVTAFFIGIRYDIQTFALCYFIANAINFFPVMFILLRLIKCPLIVFLKGLLLIGFSTIIMFLSLYYVKVNMFDEPFNLYSLILISLLGVLIYSFVLFINVRFFSSVLSKAN